MLVITHIRRLLRMPEIIRMDGGSFHSMIEAQMGWTQSSAIASYMDQTGVAWSHFVDKGRTDSRYIGFTTSEASKATMVTAMNTVLLGRSLVLHANLFSAGQKSPQVTANELFSQMGMFKRALRIPKERIYQNTRVSYSGKEGGRKDDLVMAVMMFVHYANVIMQQASY